MLERVVRPRLFVALVLLVLAILPVAALWAAHRAPACPWRTIVGLPCPGCGLGRSLLALSELELRRGLSCYPPAVALLACYVFAAVCAVRTLFGGRTSWAQSRVLRALGFAAAGLVLGNWVVQVVSS